MGANQDNGAYDLNLAAHPDELVIICDTYTSGGTVQLRTIVVGTSFVNTWLEIFTPTYTSGRVSDLDDWETVLWQGEDAKAKDFEIEVAPDDVLTIELYNAPITNIGFSEFQMTPKNSAVFNEIFNGIFSEVWAQDDTGGNFVDNPGGYTANDFSTLVMPFGTVISSKMLTAAFDSFNMLTTENIYVNNGVWNSNGYYVSAFWVHSTLLNVWVLCALDNSETIYNPILLSESLYGTENIVTFNGTVLSSVPIGSFDGVIDGIGYVHLVTGGPM